ncbi:hypothetical protein GCM10010519_56890 [Streptomyces lactacystinicus]
MHCPRAPGSPWSATPQWDGPWQVEFTGTIDPMGAPEPAGDPRAEDGEPAYWVAFDAPQYDGAGEGPYRKAQIWARHLRGAPETGALPPPDSSH